MSGIIGYIGNKRVVPVLLEGLQRLQYRGYDSAGIAVIEGDRLQVRRATGKLHNLEEVVRLDPVDGAYGVGHTRWATHGAPTEENAHPHRDCNGTVVVVHNGIIENYLELKQGLVAEGHKFATEVDTEVIAHLVEKYLGDSGAPGAASNSNNLEEAVRAAVCQLRGVFALAIISTRDPNKIIAVREGPPVVIGLGKDEYFVASDVPAILYHTRDLFFLADHDLAVLTPNGVKLSGFDGHPVSRRVQHITWDPILAEKGGFKHFTIKEIYEQPRAVRDTALGRFSLETGQVFLDEMEISEEEFRAFRDVRIVAAGTSRHAGLAGKIMIERVARVPVEVDHASEFRYSDPLVDSHTLTVLITQSGETADTIAAQREARAKGSKTLAICNVLGSMVSREAHGTIYTHAGPELGVGSTKTFTAQLTALYLFALYLAQVRGQLSLEDSKSWLKALAALPKHLETVLQKDDEIAELAQRFYRSSDFLFLGRGVHFPVALGRRAQNEEDLVHSRRSLSGRRDEARPHRSHLRRSAGGGDRHLQLELTLLPAALRTDHLEYQGSQSARRHHHRPGDRRRPRGPCHGRPPGGFASHQRDSLHHPGSGPPSTPRLPHRRPARLRCGPATELSEVRNRRVDGLALENDRFSFWV